MAIVTFYDPSAYLALDSGPTSWLIKPLIPRGGSAILWAPSKAGKSSLTLQFVEALARQEPVLGFQTMVQGKTVFLQIDNPRNIWKDRIGLLAWGDHLKDWVKFGDRESLPYPFNIRLPEHAAALKHALDLEQPDLVVVDTLRESFRGDENDSDVLQQTFSAFSGAVRPAAILYIHHSKKPPSDALSTPHVMDAGRGSTYIPGAVDTVMALKAFSPKLDKTTGELIVKGTLTLKGRALQETEIALMQDQEKFLWHLPHVVADPFKVALTAILDDPSYLTDKDRAQVLSDTFKKSTNACAIAISRQRNHP